MRQYELLRMDCRSPEEAGKYMARTMWPFLTLLYSVPGDGEVPTRWIVITQTVRGYSAKAQIIGEDGYYSYLMRKAVFCKTEESLFRWLEKTVNEYNDWYADQRGGR